MVDELLRDASESGDLGAVKMCMEKSADLRATDEVLTIYCHVISPGRLPHFQLVRNTMCRLAVLRFIYQQLKEIQK